MDNEKEHDTICCIEWSREDIRKVLEDVGKSATDDNIHSFIENFDWIYFKEKCISDGFEMLSWDIV